MDHKKSLFERLKFSSVPYIVAGLSFLPIACGGGGGGGSGSEPAQETVIPDDGGTEDGENTDPVIEDVSISLDSLADQYEGTVTVSGDVSGGDGSNYNVTLFNRLQGNTSWTETDISTADNMFTKDITLESAVHELYAGAESGGKIAETSVKSLEIWADEVNANAEIASVLEQYKQDGIIMDYFMDFSLDLGGMQIESDFAVLPDLDTGLVAGWYIGENDGNKQAEKDELESNGFSWVQIDPCLTSKIADKLDTIRTNDYSSGQILKPGQETLLNTENLIKEEYSGNNILKHYSGTDKLGNDYRKKETFDLEGSILKKELGSIVADYDTGILKYR